MTIRYFCDRCERDVTAEERREIRIARVTIEADNSDGEIETTTEHLCLSCFGNVDGSIALAISESYEAASPPGDRGSDPGEGGR